MSSGTPISYSPTDGLSYDPSDPVYWSQEGLEKEIQRTFEICHGCRMCFKFCDSFPSLFAWIDDAEHDGDVAKITAAETEKVFDQCFQCKLCEVQCPYTVRDSHEYQLDFPKLVHRYNAVRAKERGVPLRDRILGDPDRAGQMARRSFGLANALNRVQLHRVFMEKLLGIHRDKQLPDFASTTFERWAATQDDLLTDEPAGEAVLFPTCYVENNEPQIGRDTVDVMRENQVDVKCTKGLDCCGMPAWESGDLETLRKRAKSNLDKLVPFVEQGAKVLVVNPTCSMMMRQEYPELVAEEDKPRAEKLAEAVRDTGEYLWSIRDEDRFNTDFKSTPQNVSYHAPCHLRAQGKGFKGRDLLRKIPGVVPATTMECCGHDGTYAMKVEGFEPSQRVGKKAFDGMQSGGNQVWATECPLAAIQFEQHAGTKPMHPMSILARAYRADGFPDPVPPPQESST